MIAQPHLKYAVLERRTITHELCTCSQFKMQLDTSLSLAKSSDSTADNPNMVCKLIILVRRRKDISEEEFHS